MTLDVWVITISKLYTIHVYIWFSHKKLAKPIIFQNKLLYDMATYPDIQNNTAVVLDFEWVMDEFVLLTLLLNHLVLR